MELLSMATIGGLGAGCFARQGLRFPGLAFSPLPNSGDEIVALLKALEVRVPFPQLGEKSSSETGASVCANPCKTFHLFGGLGVSKPRAIKARVFPSNQGIEQK